jgi:Tfp pilus assembly protein PilV
MPGVKQSSISPMHGAALLEALLAATLLALGTVTHMQMLGEAMHEHRHGIWHKRAQNINQALRARLGVTSITADSPAYTEAITAWQQSARTLLPGGSAELTTAMVANLQRTELRTSWNAGGRTGTAVLYIYSAAL